MEKYSLWGGFRVSIIITTFSGGSYGYMESCVGCIEWEICIGVCCDIFDANVLRQF